MSWIWLLLAGYLVIVVLLFVMQRQLMYPASRETPDASLAPGFQVIQTWNGSGERLTHWLHPPAGSDGPVVVVFQGNAGHIGHRVSKFSELVAAGHGLFLTGYRGYGGNVGEPSEEGLLDDARSALAWLGAAGYAPEQLVLYGESLGSGVAVAMAGEAAGEGNDDYSYAGIILEAPFSSIADVAQSRYWFVPAKWLVKDRWDSLARIGAIDAPLLVVMGEQDEVIPVALGRRLYEAAPQPKSALFLPSAGHNNLWDHPEIPARVLEFVAGANAARQPALVR